MLKKLKGKMEQPQQQQSTPESHPKQTAVCFYRCSPYRWVKLDVYLREVSKLSSGLDSIFDVFGVSWRKKLGWWDVLQSGPKKPVISRVMISLL